MTSNTSPRTPVRYLLQIETHNGKLEMDGAETTDRDMLWLLRDRGARCCMNGRARSYAILEFKPGRKHHRIVTTGCAHNEAYDGPE